MNSELNVESEWTPEDHASAREWCKGGGGKSRVFNAALNEIERQQARIAELEEQSEKGKLLEAELEEGWKVNRAAAKREKQRAEQAEAERDEAVERRRAWKKNAEACSTVANRFKAENAKLRKAWKSYGEHRQWCGAYKQAGICGCGYRQAQVALAPSAEGGGDE